ncbi:hypothetical protein [Helicobacter sp. 13S00477-4]|uniref:hypothetical protein n=1 Tax=Helicobacter sp. 13S00477-4 TaxID=1905759 RepID=UPI000BA56924|nr:hypothetical protein [Helicobacter sp. 13S00477-4]PAF52744.1 hypothetical protein BKH44_00740 [Helicobacter sp. 13S00477-4]
MKKIFLALLMLLSLFKILLSDTIIEQDFSIENIPLKSNQILLIDYRTKKAIGIMQITQTGKIIRLPLPSLSKLKKPPIKENIKPQIQIKKPLINKTKQWDKKKIPFSTKEEIIQLNTNN